jgi:Calcium binding
MQRVGKKKKKFFGLQGYGSAIACFTLTNIIPLAADAKTIEAIADWKYWVDKGYEFSDY